MKLLALIDGTNAIMRRAQVQKHEHSPEHIAHGVVLNIRDFLAHVGASHVAVCFDSLRRNFRRERWPDYKADRTEDTRPWARRLMAACTNAGLPVVGHEGFEADDVIATMATATWYGGRVATLSSDYDLLQLTVNPAVQAFTYKQGGGFDEWPARRVCEKFGIPAPNYLTAYYALVGGKNGWSGVPGYGPKKAQRLLARWHAREPDWMEELGEHQRTFLEGMVVLNLCYSAPVDDSRDYRVPKP